MSPYRKSRSSSAPGDDEVWMKRKPITTVLSLLWSSPSWFADILFGLEEPTNIPVMGAACGDSVGGIPQTTPYWPRKTQWAGHQTH